MTVDFPTYLRLLTLALFLLGFIPELIHFFQAHILQISALLKGMIFHIIEATDKLLIRLFEGIEGWQTQDCGFRGKDLGADQAAGEGWQ